MIQIPISCVFGILYFGNTSSWASSSFTCGFVDWRPCFSWSKWPLDVAIVGLMTLSKLIPSMSDHVTKFPLLISVLKVEITGINTHQWRYFTKSDFDYELFTIIFRAWHATVWYSDLGLFSEISHKPSILLRYPVMTFFCLVTCVDACWRRGCSIFRHRLVRWRIKMSLIGQEWLLEFFLVRRDGDLTHICVKELILCCRVSIY